MRSISTFLAAVFINCCFLSAQETLKPFEYRWTADQGDGTYINPIVNADFPDCDVIRVGDTYYFASTTMYHFPGATILKSKDLVNWEFCANPLEIVLDNDAYGLLNGEHHYSQGMWASTLQYHDGKFYYYFPCSTWSKDSQSILLTAEDPEGRWEVTRLPEAYHDPGWLFDDGENGDGYLYVACGIGDIWVNKLNPKTFEKVDSKKVISVGNGCEGAHMYHIGDYYYIYATYGGTEGSQTIFRSKTPMGTYEEHKGRVFEKQHIHQGALVETQTGEWWTVLFRDNGAIGRIPYLEPVVWKNGWPVIGNNGIDVSKDGKPYPKPNVGAEHPMKYIETNDPFVAPQLGKQWAWNHNPDNSAWNLQARPGWLRLGTASVTEDLVSARNSLTQRILGFNHTGTASSRFKWCYGTIKMDVSGMQEGDVAGLSVFQTPYSFIAVKVKNGKKILYSERCTFNSQVHKKVETKEGSEISSDIIYFRAALNFGTNACRYQYSYDNENWKNFGVQMTMGYTLDFFVGQRFYLFNYATKETGGYVDIDWFSTEKTFTEEEFYSPEMLQNMALECQGQQKGLDELFLLENFNPSLYLAGTNKKMGQSMTAFRSGVNGIGGWYEPEGVDLSAYNYLVLDLAKNPTSHPVVRVYDKNTLFMSEPFVCPVTSKKVVIDLKNMITPGGKRIDPAHIYIVGIGSDGSSDIYIKDLFVSMDGETKATAEALDVSGVKPLGEQADIYSVSGVRQAQMQRGINIIKYGDGSVVKVKAE